MGTFRRSSKEWTGGWAPSIDSYNGPENALPNAVNMIADEQGILSVRQGSAVSLAIPGGEQNVDSMYTAVLNSSPTSLSVRRVVAADGSIYINGARRDQGIPGDGDIAIHSAFGKVFWTRSTRHRKDDGSGSGGDNGAGTMNWGIAKPSAPPTFETSAPDGATFATCASNESPPFEEDEGSVSFVDDHNGDGNGAVRLSPQGTTGRATATRSFGGPVDYTVYDDGDTGIEEDLIEMYIKIANPKGLDSLSLLFDCNKNTTPFTEDYFSCDLTAESVVAAKNTGTTLTVEDRGGDAFLQEVASYTMNAQTMRATPTQPAPGSLGPQFKIRKDADWARVAIPRKSFLRNGGTPDCGWNSITAVRVVAVSIQGATNDSEFNFVNVDIDRITISGGRNHPFTGNYVATYQFARNFGNYVALSPMSDPSDEIVTKTNGLQVRIPNSALAARDTQANEVWVYLTGGALDVYYRFATADISGAGAIIIDVNKREVQAVIDNIRGVTNITTPPDDIISMAGPYYGRLLALTPYGVYLSQFNNPDSFTTDEIVKIGDGGEVPYWMVICDGRVLVGTSATIWELTGTFARQPNGELDIRLSPLSVIGPNDHVVAQDGPLVAYMAPDGPRLLAGGASKLIVGSIDLLLRGYVRYGVNPPNLGLGAGRTRMAIMDRFLYIIWPETPYDNGSPIVYRHDLGQEVGAGAWWRFQYPFTLRSINKAPSNILSAGTNDGRVLQLEIGTADGEDPIDYSFTTVSEAPGGPLIRKDFHDVIFNSSIVYSNDIGTYNPPSANIYADQSTSPAITMDLIGRDTSPLTQASAEALNGARRVQLTVSGQTILPVKFFDWTLNYRERPMARAVWDTGFPDLAASVGKELVWFRRMVLTLNSPSDVTVSIYFSGVLNSQYTIPVTPNVTDNYWVPLGREVKGRQPYIKIESTTPSVTGGEFECYKLGFLLRNTGSESEMQFVNFAPESASA